jgi:hypothetical protein
MSTLFKLLDEFQGAALVFRAIDNKIVTFRAFNGFYSIEFIDRYPMNNYLALQVRFLGS